MYAMGSLRGANIVIMPTVTSTAPISGISRHAQDAGMPTTAKYGSHAALVMKPNAPWPMKHRPAPTRRLQYEDSSLMARMIRWATSANYNV